MTKEELNFTNWRNSKSNELASKHKNSTYHYERESKLFKNYWKTASNLMKKYHCKLIHYGDFSEYDGYYNKFNEIHIMSPEMFISMEGEKIKGIYCYYATLFHEIFHCVFNHEFKLGLIINKEAEEEIVEQCVYDLYSEKIPGDNLYYRQKSGKYLNECHESLFNKFFTQAGWRTFEKYKGYFMYRIKYIWYENKYPVIDCSIEDMIKKENYVRMFEPSFDELSKWNKNFFGINTKYEFVKEPTGDITMLKINK